MIFGWLKRRRRRRLLAQPLPETWLGWIEPYPVFDTLSDEERMQLLGIARVIVREKRWEAHGGLELSEEMQVVIAAQAALLLLAIEHDYYDDVTTILVFPRSYETPFPRHGPGGVVTVGTEHLGEAWYRGPVILAWDWVRHGADDEKDGMNLVLHEFAHRLDFADGWVNGTPPLHARDDYPRWVEVMTREFEDLQEAAERGRRHILDHYGATDEAEFFAVATETFFEKSAVLQRDHPELYDVLRTYYRQDPLARIRRYRGERESGFGETDRA